MGSQHISASRVAQELLSFKSPPFKYGVTEAL